MLIASDANSDDYAWTETFLTRALYRRAAEIPTMLAYIGRQAQVGMISVHFYTFSGNDWGKKSPAIGFGEADWARSMERTWKTDELIARHTAILDRHDPKGQVGISFSEWGAWWAKDEKRPSNLYQQNTLRDAVIAHGEMTLSLVNLDPGRAAKVDIDVQGGAIRTATGRVISAASMDAHPEFGKVDPLVPANLDKPAVRNGVVSLIAPAKSVIVLHLSL